MTNTKRFTKEDVIIRKDGGRFYAAVNIKWGNDAIFSWGPVNDFRTDKLPHEYNEKDYPAFWAWFDALEDDEREEHMNAADEMAREDVYSQFKEEACDLLGIRDNDAYQDGRSGGWFVFDYKLNQDNWGRSVIEGWDAIDLMKYRKVVKYAESCTKRGGECDYMFIWHLAVNIYERITWMEANAVIQAAKREDDEMAWTMELLSV